MAYTSLSNGSALPEQRCFKLTRNLDGTIVPKDVGTADRQRPLKLARTGVVRWVELLDRNTQRARIAHARIGGNLQTTGCFGGD